MIAVAPPRPHPACDVPAQLKATIKGMAEKLQQQQKAADEFAARHRLNIKPAAASAAQEGGSEGGSQGVLI